MRRLRYSGITEKWVNRQISNYEYLAHLNTIAGRSYNDLTQYPVFPAIIQDFTSETLDLRNPATFRDLSKPIGALNPDRLQAFEAKYQDMVEIGDPAMPPFHYGSHYLSAGIVLYYLVRLEPFTSLNIQLQGGRFDLPDRLFTSVKGAWDLSISNLSDVKELIPEFFYLPDFLLNLNKLPLGLRQDGSTVGDVLLPPWASTAEQFVALHRAALESDYVSAHLHEWIDLIFGYKQRGPEAVDAKNVFFHLTYAGAVDIDLIKDEALLQATIAQIYHFGQTPSQLFDKPHPRQKPLEACAAAPSRALLPITPARLRMLNAQRLLWSTETKAADNASGDVIVTRSDVLVHCYSDTNGDLRYRSRPLTATAAVTFSSTSVPIKIRKSACPSALSRTGQLLLCGGLAHGALECYLCPTGRLVSRSYAGHYAPITCMQIDPDQSYLVTGARNGTVCLWAVYLRRHTWSRPPVLSNATSTFALQGIMCAVVHVAICTSLGVLAAAYTDGTCALFSIRRRNLIRAFHLPRNDIIDLLHVTASARLLVASRGNLYVYTCNARLLRVLDWGGPITCLASNKTGDFVVVGGRGTNRVTIHSYVEMDAIQEIEYGAVTASEEEMTNPAPSSDVYPIAIDLGPKETCLAIALSDQTVCVVQLPTNKEAEGDVGLLALTVDVARDVASNTYEILRDSLESPIEATKQAVTHVNEQLIERLDRSTDAATASNLWTSLSKVKGKIFGGKH